MNNLHKKIVYKLCKSIFKKDIINNIKYNLDKQRELLNDFFIYINKDLSKNIYKLIYMILKIEKSFTKLVDFSNLYKHTNWPVYIYKGDITNLIVDVIVNCSDKDCLGCFKKNHICINQRIHLKAGPLLRRKCRNELKDKKLLIGSIFVTKSYNLPCKKIIHAITPEYSKLNNKDHYLKKCYIDSLEYCKKNGYTSIAFPALATEYKKFPLKESIILSMANIKSWLIKNNYKINIIFCSNNTKHHLISNYYLPKIFKINESKHLPHDKPIVIPEKLEELVINEDFILINNDINIKNLNVELDTEIDSD